MTDNAISFHFTKAQATVSGSPLHRLSCEHGHRPTRPRVNLVIHHVLEALVVCGVQEDLGFELTTGMTVVHHLPPSALVTLPAHKPRKDDKCLEHLTTLQLRDCQAASKHEASSKRLHDLHMRSDAFIDAAGAYRYLLLRSWDDSVKFSPCLVYTSSSLFSMAAHIWGIQRSAGRRGQGINIHRSACMLGLHPLPEWMQRLTHAMRWKCCPP